MIESDTNILMFWENSTARSKRSALKKVKWDCQNFMKPNSKTIWDLDKTKMTKSNKRSWNHSNKSITILTHFLIIISPQSPQLEPKTKSSSVKKRCLLTSWEEQANKLLRTLTQSMSQRRKKTRKVKEWKTKELQDKERKNLIARNLTRRFNMEVWLSLKPKLWHRRLKITISNKTTPSTTRVLASLLRWIRKGKENQIPILANSKYDESMLLI